MANSPTCPLKQRIYTILTPAEVGEALAAYVGKRRGLPAGDATNWMVNIRSEGDPESANITQARVEFDYEPTVPVDP